MSTQPNLTPQWKEEVNRRIAAHKNRRNPAANEDASAPAANAGASRAAEAAARVAARYAKAPTYSQMQAEEARVAVRHAEIATKVALEAQAVAENALAGLHAASQEQMSRGPAVVQTIARKSESHAQAGAAALPSESVSRPAAEMDPVRSAAPAIQEQAPREPLEVRWDPDLPVRPPRERRPSQNKRSAEEFELSVEDWWNPAEAGQELRQTPIEVGEADPGHANLIQFPRELVATRKMRPRLAESCVTEAEGQLSIFEVDPGTVSTEAAAPAVSHEGAAGTWTKPEWSGMRLDTQPASRATSTRVNASATHLPVAPMGLRLMAAVVDGALILAGFVLTGFAAAHNFQNPPTGKAAELLGIGALAAIGLVYYAIFFMMEVSTPGMKYAGIGLCTFDSQSPTRKQLQRRLGAMVLSLLPIGLGVAWSIFDEEHLSWHDRFSQTYLRKC